MKKTTTLSIQGMHCASCATIITKALQKTAGVESANVNFSTAKAFVQYDDSQINEQKLMEIVKSKGYSAGLPRTPEEDSKIKEGEIARIKKLLLISITLSLPALIIGMLFMPDGIFYTGYHVLYAEYLLFILATPVQFYVGWSFYKGTWAALKNKTANMDSLIAIGTSAAYFFSVYSTFFADHASQYFEVSSILITLVVLGKFLEEARIRVRKDREDALREADRLEKAKEISEDQKFRQKNEIQKQVDETNKKLEDLHHNKEKEIMTV